MYHVNNVISNYTEEHRIKIYQYHLPLTAITNYSLSTFDGRREHMFDNQKGYIVCFTVYVEGCKFKSYQKITIAKVLKYL
jgi:hypothetical protein